MKSYRKLLAFLMACSMMLGTLATGCSQAESGSSGSGDGGQSGGDTKPAETVELDWYIGGTPQEKQDDVFADINEILVDKLNTKVDFHYIDFNSYGQQMQMLMTSGEKIDMMYTSNWANDFYSDVSKGAYQEIDMEMVKEYGPNIMKEVPETVWKGAVVNGKTYAIPNIQVLARWPAMVVQKKYIDKYNFDPSTVKGLDDFTDLFEQIAKNEDGISPVRLIKNSGVLSLYISNMGLEYFSETNPLGIRIDDPDLKIVNLYETEEMKNYLNILRDWYNKGIIRKDAASVTDVSAEFANGKIASFFAVNNPDMLPGQAATMGLKPEDLTVITLSDPYLSTSAVVATMTAINAKTTNAKECIQVLNEFFDSEDTRVQNLLSFGIEGVNYNKVEDDLIEMLPNTGYTENCGWAHGSLFNCFRIDASQPSWCPTGPDINAEATVSPMMGFNFDPSPVKNELAQVAAVMDEFAPTLQTGSADVDETLAQMNEKLEQAGLANLQKEMQKQLDEWKAQQ